MLDPDKIELLKTRNDLITARKELAEMYDGVRFHGERGKNYWAKWLATNDWFFDMCQRLIAEELKRMEV